MRKKEFAALARLVVPSEFAIKGDLAFVHPVDHTLRAITFESSAFTKTSFYVTWLFNPLCVPRKHLNLGLGNRIRHGWESGEADLVDKLRAEIQKVALPVFERLRTPADVAREQKVRMRGAPYECVPVQQELGFALARAGDVAGAVHAFDKLLELIEPTSQWNQDAAILVMSLKDLLLRDPGAAMRQLLAWEAETLQNLGLSDYSAPRG